MSVRPLSDVIGLVFGAMGGVIGNLVAAGIQQRAFPGPFSREAIVILIFVMVVCLVVAHWLGGPQQVGGHANPSARDNDSNVVTVTRFRAIFSPTTLRGRGIHVEDSTAFGSKIDIDARD